MQFRVPAGEVTFDRKSFRVGGRRVWLHAGDLHYFRHPCELWEEALRRVKAAGLNTISTYVAWNFHAPREDQVDFTGDRDLGRFLDLVQSLGMFAVVRPGPYICSEWDGGGLPAWLLGKPGIQTRDDDPVYMKYVERWFQQVLPHVAPRQTSRGGPVILVQNENEYNGGWNESTRSYMRKINAMFRAGDIDVPIIACNCHGRPPYDIVINGTADPADQFVSPDMILTYNWGPGAEPVRKLQARQPDKPLFMTEYWSGPQVYWGKPIGDYCAAPEYARSMLEFASLGCQITYYMFDGGTNFEYWSGRNIATSYQSNYPVREGGALGDKYYRLNPVNHFITQFADELAESDEVVDRLGLSVSDGVRLVVRKTPAGHLLFVSHEGVRPRVNIGLPGGESLEVAWPSIRAFALPLDLEVLPGLRLESSNLGLLGRSAGMRAVVLWGRAGTEGCFRVNGRQEKFTIPADRVLDIPAGDARILVVDEGMAGRTWFPGDGRIVFGSDFAELSGKGSLVIRHSDVTSRICVLDRDGLSPVACPAVAPLPGLPALTDWRRQECPERMAEGEGWQPLPDGPKSHEDLGRLYGYVWYRAEYEAKEDGFVPLFAPMRSTRLSVYVNGVYSGTSGELSRFVEFCGYRHPADAWQQDQVEVPIRKGINRFVFLSDHLGRWFNGKPDIQGLRGPVYLGARRVSLAGAKTFAPAPILEEAFPSLYHREFRTPQPLPGVEMTVDVPRGTDGCLILPSGLVNIAVSVDGRHVAAMPKAKFPSSFVRLPEWISGRRIVLRIQSEAVGGFAPCLEHVGLFLFSRRNTLRGWAWKAGGEWPADAVSAASLDAVSVGGGKEAWGGLMPDQKNPAGAGAKPAYYLATFPRPEGDLPVFLHIGKLHKGQLFLNGRNLGRFWQIGGFAGGNGVQSSYYLPRPWMQAENTLAVFEEYGLPPQEVSLVWGVPGNRARTNR